VTVFLVAHGHYLLESVILVVCVVNLVLDHHKHGTPRPPHGPVK
jgi:hypothetical protein